MNTVQEVQQEPRAQAVSRLERTRDFRVHVSIYVAVNTMLVSIWAVAGAGLFWPIFPMLGWGIGVAANAWVVYGRRALGEDEIRREVERLRD
jgi:hypothetical protein